MNKKIALLLVLMLLLNATFIYGEENLFKKEAKVLYDLGLFSGRSSTSYDPDLQGSMNRQEAMKMIVVALGWEIASETECPFSDVDKWAKPYVAKAYKKGITIGYSDKTFGAKDSVSLVQLLTFYLRALGYETTYAYENAETLGIKTGLSNGISENMTNLKRYDMVKVTYNALSSTKKDMSITLIEELILNKKIDREKAIELGLTHEYKYQWQRDNGAKEITEDEFDKKVLQCSTPVLVEFYVSEEEASELLKPFVNETAKELADEVKVVRINGDIYTKIAEQYNITTYPTLKLFNKESIDNIPTFQDKEVLINWVKNKL